MEGLQRSVAAFCFLLVGCAQATSDVENKAAELPDAALSGNPNDRDGDGALTADDCDDNDSNRYPGALETCDSVDQDCDGTVDEEASDASTFYADTDGDGFGDPAATVSDCGSAPQGFVSNSDDCFDGNADAKPGQTQFFATERGDGSFDYDCTGNEDSNRPAGNCSFNGSNCGFAEGWEDGAPACGTSGRVVTGCLEICIGACICDASTDNETNVCR